MIFLQWIVWLVHGGNVAVNVTVNNAADVIVLAEY
jgi:hypothetical protein